MFPAGYATPLRVIFLPSFAGRRDPHHPGAALEVTWGPRAASASRPTLARLAKIGQIAEQVASTVSARNDADHPVGVA